MPLSLAILSDLHLEQSNYSILDIFSSNVLAESDALCLLGDIGSPLMPNFFRFIQDCSLHAKEVIFVPGNHEYYNMNQISITELDRVMKAACDEYENVTFLKNQSTTLPNKADYSIVGSTLWSHIPVKYANDVLSSIDDYKYIFCDNQNTISIDDVNAMHKESVKFISDSVASATLCNQKAVVLTHHVPLAIGTTHPRHKGTALNAAYVTDLCDFMYTRDIRFWACGHTHYNFDITLANNTRVVSNQRGCHAQPIKDFRTISFVIP